MYYSDLSNYEYDLTEPIAGVLNVGWLSRGHEFRRGAVSQPLLEKLERLTARAVANQMRGLHYCEFCSVEDVSVTFGGKRYQLGSAEIWVRAGDILFAAPDLIAHYIRAHEYEPPRQFLDAVENADEAHWDPEGERLRKMGRATMPRPPVST